MNNKPSLEFSKWMKWEGRKEFDKIKCPGIYMLAITDKNLENKEYDFEDVDYIGMSNSTLGLGGRWNQFERSINGKDPAAHSGGKKIYKELKLYKDWKKKLFVCAQAFRCNVSKKSRKHDDLITMGWIAYLEYEAMAKFKEKKGNEPRYNTK